MSDEITEGVEDVYHAPKRISAYNAPESAPTGYVCRRIRIPNDLRVLAAVNDVLAYLTHEDVWTPSASVTEWDMRWAMGEMLYEYLSGGCMLGAIFLYVSADPPPHCLPCDGKTYDAADYPELYDALDDALKLPGDKFQTPDLRGRFVFGADETHLTNSTGGAESVTLTTDQLPAHAHTTQPHTHTEGISVPAIINGGIEAPASAAVPAAGATGAATVAVDNTGGGQPHDNMPPYMALKYCMVAR